MTETILVIGGTGMLGQPVARRLAAEEEAAQVAGLQSHAAALPMQSSRLRLLHMSALPFRMSYYLLKSCLLLTTTGFKYLHFRTFCFSPFTLSLLSKV